jgi:hypothetical protein
MSDLGLIMNDAMARACHEGRKTVTRRPLSVQPPTSIGMHPVDLTYRNGELLGYAASDFPVWSGGPATIPGAGTAKVGARVWIRECWTPVDGDGWGLPRGGNPIHKHPNSVVYRASAGDSWKFGDCTWRPSIHMPKWAARTWGRIVSVRPERLQDITDDDARREGCTEGFVARGMLPHVAAFRSVWNDCYANRGLGWDANPWVWRIEWERIERPDFAEFGSTGST